MEEKILAENHRRKIHGRKFIEEISKQKIHRRKFIAENS
jgi:hypothetical protein